VRRLLASLLLILVLTPATCLRQPLQPATDIATLRFIPQRLPPKAELARHLGAFDLEGAWQMTSPHWRFNGYSALLALGGGELLAISDRSDLLRFSEPGAPPRPIEIRPIRSNALSKRYGYDSESATYDPESGRVWLGWEGSNRISLHGLDFGPSQTVSPPAMRDWGLNAGPESMVRLTDGRFIVLREGADGWLDDNHHRALLFPDDPLTGKTPEEFTFVGLRGFSPVDAAQLPDGRVLILMRRLVWPFPVRFAGRIMIADPADIRPGENWQAKEVAKLSSSLHVDNFEGMAIEPGDNGRVIVWLISDANAAITQRTLLWKLTVDPKRLPR